MVWPFIVHWYNQALNRYFLLISVLPPFCELKTIFPFYEKVNQTSERCQNLVYNDSVGKFLRNRFNPSLSTYYSLWKQNTSGWSIVLNLGLSGNTSFLTDKSAQENVSIVLKVSSSAYHTLTASKEACRSKKDLTDVQLILFIYVHMFSVHHCFPLLISLI